MGAVSCRFGDEAMGQKSVDARREVTVSLPVAELFAVSEACPADP